MHRVGEPCKAGLPPARYFLFAVAVVALVLPLAEAVELVPPLLPVLPEFEVSVEPLDESLLVVPVVELPVPELLELSVVEFEPLPVPELSLVVELLLPEFELLSVPLALDSCCVAESPVDEFEVSAVVSEVEPVLSVSSDSVGFSGWVVSWGFSASGWVVWVCVVVSCVRPGVVPMPLPSVSA